MNCCFSQQIYDKITACLFFPKWMAQKQIRSTGISGVILVKPSAPLYIKCCRTNVGVPAPGLPPPIHNAPPPSDTDPPWLNMCGRLVTESVALDAPKGQYSQSVMAFPPQFMIPWSSSQTKRLARFWVSGMICVCDSTGSSEKSKASWGPMISMCGTAYMGNIELCQCFNSDRKTLECDEGNEKVFASNMFEQTESTMEEHLPRC